MLKKSLVAVCLFGAFVAFVGCGDDKEEAPGGGAGGTTGTAFSCTSWCEKGASLNCSSCKASCDSQFALAGSKPECKSKVTAYTDCLSALTVDQLQCSSGALGTKGACTAEFNTVLACVVGGGGGTGGEGGAGGAGGAGGSEAGAAGEGGAAGEAGAAGNAGSAGAQ